MRRGQGDHEYNQIVSYALQFSRSHVLRDVAKARVAFQGRDRVSTGMWGCGQFQGNVYLKFLEQLIAAAQVGTRELSFTAFGMPDVAEQCERLLAELERCGRTPDDALAFLCCLEKQEAPTSDGGFLSLLFEWVKTLVSAI